MQNALSWTETPFPTHVDHLGTRVQQHTSMHPQHTRWNKHTHIHAHTRTHTHTYEALIWPCLFTHWLSTNKNVLLVSCYLVCTVGMRYPHCAISYVCMYMYAYMYVCMYACTCMQCMYACMQCMYVHYVFCMFTVVETSWQQKKGILQMSSY